MYEDYKVFKFVTKEGLGKVIMCEIIKAKDIESAKLINHWEKGSYNVSEITIDDFFDFKEEQLKKAGFEDGGTDNVSQSREDKKEKYKNIRGAIFTGSITTD